jgi:prophage tail gpP-like protein
VDCSVVDTTGEWKGLKLEKIIEHICKPFGIKVTTQIDTGSPITAFNVEQGMTAFEAIQKLCQLRACLALSDNKGGITITRAGKDSTSSALMEGVNIKSAEAEYDFSERFSQYVVKGQQQGSDNTGALNTTSVKGVVRDENVARYRPVLIVSDGQVNSEQALMRAKWEASVKKGKSRLFTVVVNHWQQKDNTLWEINKRVKLKSPMLGIDDTLIIAGLIYKLDEEGETTELALTDASAYEVLKENTIKKSSSTSKSNPYIP